MTIPFGVAQLLRGSIALVFPLLWQLERRSLLAGSVVVAMVAYATGRAAIARGGPKALPMADVVTPFGESVMVASALALAIRVTATHDLHTLGLAGGGGVVGAVLLAHAVALPLAGQRAAEVTAERRRVAAVAGLVGELALSIALLTVAAEALADTLAGPIRGRQLVTSPWPAWLGMGLAFLPLVRMSLAELDPPIARRRALEAAAVTWMGLSLVGLGGPGWWP